VVVGARYLAGDASGAAMLLAVLRALAPARTRRSLRFVFFANELESGRRYVERLLAERRTVHSMISLVRLDLARAGRRSTLLFVGNMRSRSVARAARDAFRASSRIPASALALPSWLPGLQGGGSSDHAAFWRQGWPAIIATDAAPWRTARPAAGTVDIDRMAAAVPGLAAAVARLAGGRI
jgi:Zn-dependent M28 family amino/carboxypeptidase